MRQVKNMRKTIPSRENDMTRGNLVLKKQKESQCEWQAVNKGENWVRTKLSSHCDTVEMRLGSLDL